MPQNARGAISALMTAHDLDETLTALRGAGEETRLRILALLASGELAVAELTQILDQSQPRVSRHLRLLAEAGLIERRREGAWAFFRLARTGLGADLAGFLLARLAPEDPALGADRAGLERVRRRRAEQAAAYVQERARAGDALRDLQAPAAEAEAAALELLRPAQEGRFRRFLDLGAGDGRMLEIFAGRFLWGLGYDLHPPMLAYARARLQGPEFPHCELRQADILNLPEASGAADGAICHQVLRYLSDPPRAVAEAARCLAPGGRLLIGDFAPHKLEELRERHAHRRLGFSDAEMAELCAAAGLKLVETRKLKPPTKEGVTLAFWLAEKVSRSPEAEARPAP